MRKNYPHKLKQSYVQQLERIFAEEGTFSLQTAKTYLLVSMILITVIYLGLKVYLMHLF